MTNVIVSTGCQTTIPTVIEYTEYAADSWLLIPMENELAKLADKESTKKYYFVDNGLLNLFLIDDDPSLLENMVAVELCRRYGKENVSYYNAGNEIDFIVAEENLAIQVSYSLAEKSTRERELAPLQQFAKKHPGWKLQIITFDEEDTSNNGDTSIDVIPAWKWAQAE